MQHTETLELNSCIYFLRTGKEVSRNDYFTLHDISKTFCDSRDSKITELFIGSPENDTAWLPTQQEIKADHARRAKEKEYEQKRANMTMTTPSSTTTTTTTTDVKKEEQQQQQTTPIAPLLEFKRKVVPTQPPTATKSILTQEIQQSKRGNGGGGGSSSTSKSTTEVVGPSMRLTIYYPDRTPNEVRIGKMFTVEQTIAMILERSTTYKRRKKEDFELRMHDEDGIPDEDFPALDRACLIGEFGSNEFCLVDLKEGESHIEEEPLVQEEEQVTLPPLPAATRSKSFSGRGGGSLIHVVFMDNDHHDQQYTMQRVEPGGDSKAKVFLKKIVKELQLPLFAEEYQFHVTEEDKERLQMVTSVIHPNDDVLSLGVEKLLLRKRRYADAPPDVESVLRRNTGGVDKTTTDAAANQLTSAPMVTTNATTDQQTQQQPITPVVAPKQYSKSKSMKRPATNGKNQLAVDPESILLNEIKAAVYEEWKVVKTNNWGKHQNRILGIDLQKIYNKPVGGERVKVPERLISDITSIELNPNNAAAFTIKMRDTTISSNMILNYEAESADEAARIVAKVKYIMQGRMRN